MIPRNTPIVIFGGLAMRTDPMGAYVGHADHADALKAANDRQERLRAALEYARDQIHSERDGDFTIMDLLAMGDIGEAKLKLRELHDSIEHELKVAK